jgi:hypothetical protein
MDRSGFLPDAETLDALLAAAGLTGLVSDVARIEFVRFPNRSAEESFAPRPQESIHAPRPQESIHARPAPQESIHAARPQELIHAARPQESIHAPRPVLQESIHAARPPSDDVRLPKRAEPSIHIPQRASEESIELPLPPPAPLPPPPSAPVLSIPPIPRPPMATRPAPPPPPPPSRPQIDIEMAELDDGWGGPADSTRNNAHRSRINLPPLEHVDSTPPHGISSKATIEQRLAVLVDWLMGSTASYSAFVADSEGLALANRNAPDNYIAVTALIGRAQHLLDEFVPAPVDGATSMELEDGNTLQIVWASTDAGRLAAGMVLPQPLARTICVAVRNMVRAAVANEEAR